MLIASEELEIIKTIHDEIGQAQSAGKDMALTATKLLVDLKTGFPYFSELVDFVKKYQKQNEQYQKDHPTSNNVVLPIKLNVLNMFTEWQNVFPKGVLFYKPSNIGRFLNYGQYQPLLVIHYTANASGLEVGKNAFIRDFINDKIRIDNAIENPSQRYSTHYLIGESSVKGKDIDFIKCVPKSDIAFTCGSSQWYNYDKKNDKIIPTNNVNDYSLSIEMTGNEQTVFPFKYYFAILNLAQNMRYNFGNNGIPVWRMVGHRHISKSGKQNDPPKYGFSFFVLAFLAGIFDQRARINLPLYFHHAMQNAGWLEDSLVLGLHSGWQNGVLPPLETYKDYKPVSNPISLMPKYITFGEQGKANIDTTPIIDKKNDDYNIEDQVKSEEPIDIIEVDYDTEETSPSGYTETMKQYDQAMKHVLYLSNYLKENMDSWYFKMITSPLILTGDLYSYIHNWLSREKIYSLSDFKKVINYYMKYIQTMYETNWKSFLKILIKYDSKYNGRILKVVNKIYNKMKYVFEDENLYGIGMMPAGIVGIIMWVLSLLIEIFQIIYYAIIFNDSENVPEPVPEASIKSAEDEIMKKWLEELEKPIAPEIKPDKGKKEEKDIFIAPKVKENNTLLKIALGGVGLITLIALLKSDEKELVIKQDEQYYY